MNTLVLRQPLDRFGSGIGHAARALLAQWRAARELRETRRYVAEMDDRMLADIGVSRAQALFDLDNARPPAPWL